MADRATFTFLEMAVEPFFDMLDHVVNLVTRNGFSFADAVPEALGFTVTNEVMDIDSEYRRLKPLFDREGYLKDPLQQSRLIREVSQYVQESGVVGVWMEQNKLLSRDDVNQVQHSAAKLARPNPGL